jgi:hypothetical protein
MYKTTENGTLTYEADTWTLRQKHKIRNETTERKMEIKEDTV